MICELLQQYDTALFNKLPYSSLVSVLHILVFKLRAAILPSISLYHFIVFGFSALRNLTLALVALADPVLHRVLGFRILHFIMYCSDLDIL